MWQPIETAPKDGTKVLVRETRKDDEIPTVAEWYDPLVRDGYEDGEALWVPSEEALCMMTDQIEPKYWCPIPDFKL